MEQLPPGWIKEESNGRVLFFSPPPQRLKIDCNATLKNYQRKGKLLEVSCLIFKRKTSVKKVGHTIVAIEDAQNENDEISKKDKKIKADADKMTWAVQQLTLDPLHPVDHRQELEEVARKLNKVRISSSGDQHEEDAEIQNLKLGISKCEKKEDVIKVLSGLTYVREQFSFMERSSMLQEMLQLSRSSNNSPLSAFPPSVNSNLYASIIRLGLQHSPKLLSLLLDLQIDREKCISPDNVIKLAFTFSQLAASVNGRLSTVGKVRSLGFRSGGLSKEGLDTSAALGMTSSSKCEAEQREFLSGIVWELISNHAKKFPHQSTMDNMDFSRNGILHHMTLCFIEIEQRCTKHLSSEGKSYAETLDIFSPSLLLIKSEQNKAAKDQLDKVVTITLGRLFAQELADKFPELKWMLTTLPNHYNSDNNVLKPSVLLTKKPMYYQETKNTDMVKIVEQEQLDYLRLVM